MRQVITRRRSRAVASGAALAVAAAGFVTFAAGDGEAEAAEAPLTDHVVAINETVSDAGFVHPGVGLSADDLRTAQENARAGVEPWASYFETMAQTRPWADTDYEPSNMVAGEPDVPLSPDFDNVGIRYRMNDDSFGAMSQALMWVVTGDEAYRRNAIQALRTWGNMNPDGYEYFADAHIHTGQPLYQFLMAAEIIRATEPVDDDSPGTYEGYDVVWSEVDDEHLVDNLATPIGEVFNFSNERWMNQHNFGLFGRIATAVYTDDVEAYELGVEWFTVNAEYDGYDNGAMAPLMPLIEADDPLNAYGRDFVQIREMGRDQAHAETNINNFTSLSRMLEVQGTEVDPVDGTVSTAEDAVSPYDFLDRRLLAAANAFSGFMMGAPTPWIDERDVGGTVSQAYRGRIFNSLSELYYEYAYERGVDVEAEAPWIAELHSRIDGPRYYYGAEPVDFWAPGDLSPEYWVAFPEELAGTAPEPVPDDASIPFSRFSLQLDDRSEQVEEDGRAFVRAHADETGTTNVVSRLMHAEDGRNGLLFRSDGPAKLEVFNKEEPSGLYDNETEPRLLATVELPDTGGEWRYVDYPADGMYAHFYKLTSEDGATVDLDSVTLSAHEDLTVPSFERLDDRYYLVRKRETAVDLAAEGEAPAYTAEGLPEGAELDGATGELTWTPSANQTGRHTVRLVADDGESVGARTVELVVAKTPKKLVEAAVADGFDPDTDYTAATGARFDEALAAAEEAARHGSDEEFAEAFAALLEAIEGLEPLNPSLADGSLDYTGLATPTVITPEAVEALADDDNETHFGDLRVDSLVLDFGTGYRVTADEFDFRARFDFGNRSQGTNVYGSDDGIEWTPLSERETSETNDWETVPVLADQRDEAYRYFKLQVDTPGEPTDPAYPGLWSIAEFRVHGERSEVPGTVEAVSFSSPDAVGGRVVEGDEVTLAFDSPTPIEEVAVEIGGESVEAVSDDARSWTATTTLGAVDGSAPLGFAIDHVTDTGATAETVGGTTDGSGLYASDERDLIDLASAAQVVDASGEPDADAEAHALAMLDGDAETFSDVAAVDGEAHLIWDFGDGSTAALDRVDFLARQDDNGTVRMDDLILEGSNDLESWTPLTEPTRRTHAWQPLPSIDDGDYRYVRVRNGAAIDIAELRLFGSVA